MNEVRQTLLVVDDSPEDRALYRRLLAQGGGEQWQVVEAGCGEEALARCLAHPPACVLLDYNLPDVDGLELLDRLAAADVQVPVIMATGQGNEQLAVEALRHGVQDYLIKNAVTREGLLRTLGNACEKVALQRALEMEREKLQQSNAELERRNGEMHRYHHTLSHELRTPLTAAREFLSLVLETADERLGDQDRRCLQLAREACDQMTVCVDDLLDATRLETGKLAVHPRAGEIDRLIADVTATLSFRACERGLVLRSDVAPHLPRVSMDEPRIVQVLTNLLTNALKFTPHGGQVTVRARIAGERPGFVVVDVEDTGRGIAADALGRIFERYAQTRTSDANEKGGIGLGLSIAREILRLHQGDLWVESEVGRGTTFSFSLPVADQAGSEVAGTAEEGGQEA